MSEARSSSAGGTKRTFPSVEELRRLADEDRDEELYARLKDRTASAPIAAALERRREAAEEEQQQAQRKRSKSDSVKEGSDRVPMLPRDVMRLILLRTDNDTLSSAALTSVVFAHFIHCDDYFWREKFRRDLPGLAYLWDGDLPLGFSEGTGMTSWKVYYVVAEAFYQHLAEFVSKMKSSRSFEGQHVLVERLEGRMFRKTTYVDAVLPDEPLSVVDISFDRFLRVCFGWITESFVKHLVEDLEDEDEDEFVTGNSFKYNHVLNDDFCCFFLHALRARDVTHSVELSWVERKLLMTAAVLNRSDDRLSLFDFFKRERGAGLAKLLPTLE